MEDRKRQELEQLRDEFLEIMRRENAAALFDEEGKRRLGEAISGQCVRAARSSPTATLGHDAAEPYFA
jgi:hypothetical protein